MEWYMTSLRFGFDSDYDVPVFDDDDEIDPNVD